MAILKILTFPNPNLQITAEPITDFGGNLQTMIEDMIETMYDANGIGLAGTQVDFHKRIFVMDVVGDKKDLRVCINPKIVSHSGQALMQEGCLSLPGGYGSVKRATHLTLEYQDPNRTDRTLEADGLIAHCVQHEIDHLNGTLYRDRLSRLKQSMLDKQLKKFHKDSQK